MKASYVPLLLILVIREVICDNYCYGLLTSYGDDATLVEVSHDKGEEFQAISESHSWIQPLYTPINHITGDTILRFTITNAQDIAGFLATMKICSSNETKHCVEFYTDQGLTKNMGFVSEQSVSTSFKYGTGEWKTYVNPSTNGKHNPGSFPLINDSAYWASWYGDYFPNIFTFDCGLQKDTMIRLGCETQINTIEPNLNPNTDTTGSMSTGWIMFIIIFILAVILLLIIGYKYVMNKRRLDRALLAFRQMRHYGTNDEQGQRIDTP